MRIEMELRNVRHTLVMDFLFQAGGQSAGALAVQGEGWHASLEALKPARVGTTIQIKRDLLVIEGDNETIVTPVYDFMRKNMIRGGG